MRRTFQEAFARYRDRSIAVYGLGNAAKKFLEKAENRLHIVGLLDGYRTEGELYGLPVLSMKELVTAEVSAIVIAARPGSRRIIVSRIREFCGINGIELLDLDGNALGGPAEEKVITAAGIGREELLQKIDAHEAVSFDVFDTLLTRRTLYPGDVYELVERKIPASMQIKSCFCRERQLAESELSREAVPTWEEIYRRLAEKNGLTFRETEELKRLEWETEQSVLTPRTEMRRVLRYALKMGKKVYLLSDMYFSGKQIAYLLEQNGITGYEKLFVSCEYGITKEDGLFWHLRKETGTKPVLHIGDSQEADVESAEKYGITGILVPCPRELFEESGPARKLDRRDALGERIRIGMFAAYFFNSPFRPEKDVNAIEEPEELGYLLFAPVLTDFVLWLQGKLRENGEQTMLFGARDGYLIKKLFDELQDGDKKKGTRTHTGGGPARDRNGEETRVESVYFLTSRLSAVLAGIQGERDISLAAGAGYGGSFRQMLKTRFMLTDGEIGSGEEDIGRYHRLILERATEKRENYLAYIRKSGLKDGKIAFFDFVSSGTCQLALEHITGRRLKGYYFMRVWEACDEKKRLDIESFYTSEKAEGKKGVYEDYFILENILTSPSPSLQAFDEKGEPIYLTEDRTEEEITFMERVHRGVREYFRSYLEIWGNAEAEVSKELSESILGLIHCIPVDNEIFREMRWTDAFYGRCAKVEEML